MLCLIAKTTCPRSCREKCSQALVQAVTPSPPRPSVCIDCDRIQTQRRMLLSPAVPQTFASSPPVSGHKRPNADAQSSAIAKHLCESPACANAYSQDWFSIVDVARSGFHLSTLEAAYISSTDPVLCRQKSFVYALQVCKGL